MSHKFVLSNLDMMNFFSTYPIDVSVRKLCNNVLESHTILDTPIESSNYPFLVHVMHNILLAKMFTEQTNIENSFATTNEIKKINRGLKQIKIIGDTGHTRLLRLALRLKHFNNMDRLHYIPPTLQTAIHSLNAFNSHFVDRFHNSLDHKNKCLNLSLI